MADPVLPMLVHDLRTPLAGMRLYLEMLRADAETMGAAPDFLEMLDEAGAVALRMSDMINDAMDAKRFEMGALRVDPADSDLLRIAQEAIAIVRAQGRKRPVEVAAATDARVRCDPILIRRVVANLIGNAVDFSPEDSPVRVAIESDRAGVRVRVTDSGSGIPAYLKDAIFEPHGQAEALKDRVRHSTGLGLAFCRLAVLAHGGRIGVESEEGHGSTFWFMLPAPA
jgi:two-component system sensor histidine kinase/response regulator